MTHALKQRSAGVIYFLASMIGILASTYESHVGMIAAYVLFVGSVLSFISAAKWCLWPPFIGSVVLACYVVPTEIRNVFIHPTIFSDVQTIALHGLLVGMVTLSLVISFLHLVKPSAAGTSEIGG